MHPEWVKQGRTENEHWLIFIIVGNETEFKRTEMVPWVWVMMSFVS